MKPIEPISMLAIGLAACFFTACRSVPRSSVPTPQPEALLRSSAELDQILGPIALYPDPLLAEILPATTWPADIVLANRYLEGGGDTNLIDQQPWHPSVQALARYPSVLQWLDQNLAWTRDLGMAFLHQPQAVMDSIQRLRAQALALGNLRSTPEVTVLPKGGIIRILPAEPEVLYVPVYEPEEVFVETCDSSCIFFGAGCWMGAWLHHDFDWHHHHIVSCGNDHQHPADGRGHHPGERPSREVTATAGSPARLPAGQHPGEPGAVRQSSSTHQSNNSVTPVIAYPRPTGARLVGGGMAGSSGQDSDEPRQPDRDRQQSPETASRSSSAPSHSPTASSASSHAVSPSSAPLHAVSSSSSSSHSASSSGPSHAEPLSSGSSHSVTAISASSRPEPSSSGSSHSASSSSGASHSEPSSSGSSHSSSSSSDSSHSSSSSSSSSSSGSSGKH